MKVTEFLRPDAERQEHNIDVPEDIEKQTQELIDAGFYFEVEALPTNQVHLECCDEDGEIILGSKIVPNDLQITERLIELVKESYSAYSKG